MGKAVQKFVAAGGCSFRITDTGGDGCPLVLLHGYLESSDVWEDFIPLLSDRCRVIAPDLPGHGISEVKGPVHTMEFLADTVKALLNKLNIAQAVVAGHSMGGYAALEFLHRYPASTAGLILLHSTPDPDSEAKKADRLREENLVLAGRKELLGMTVAKGFAAGNRVRLADRLEELADQITLTDDDGIVALLRGMSGRSDRNETLRRSKAPQMFVFGLKDEHIPSVKAQAIAEAHPQARIVWLEHSGHMGFMEEPQRTADAIADFCCGICAKSGTYR